MFIQKSFLSGSLDSMLVGMSFCFLLSLLYSISGLPPSGLKTKNEASIQPGQQLMLTLKLDITPRLLKVRQFVFLDLMFRIEGEKLRCGSGWVSIWILVRIQHFS
jgi:hypothetical protein